MESNDVHQAATDQAKGFGGCLLWFLWGGALSVMITLSLALILLLAGSLVLNLYLGWQLAGLEVSISRSAAQPAMPGLEPVLAAVPTNTPPALPASPPTTGPGRSPLEIQLATLAALATEVATTRVEGTPAAVILPTATPLSPPEPLPPPATAEPPAGAPAGVPTAAAISPPAGEPDSAGPAYAPPGDSTAKEDSAGEAELSSSADAFTPPTSSSNTYNLIPIQGEREKRPGDEHGDLNLKLREPQPIEAEAALVDAGAGVDPNAPQLSKVFEPNFTGTYAVRNWDWGCNCPGDLIQDGQAILVGIKTTPGEPVFIPPKEQDIYEGKYYAVVLYASEDSLTFVYAREGTVAKGYTVHYLGLNTDPNLLALYRESKGNELPGLTLDTPVGTATDQLIVAIRDNGTFLDARSKNDWWK